MTLTNIDSLQRAENLHLLYTWVKVSHSSLETVGSHYMETAAGGSLLLDQQPLLAQPLP